MASHPLKVVGEGEISISESKGGKSKTSAAAAADAGRLGCIPGMMEVSCLMTLGSWLQSNREMWVISSLFMVERGGRREFPIWTISSRPSKSTFVGSEKEGAEERSCGSGALSGLYLSVVLSSCTELSRSEGGNGVVVLILWNVIVSEMTF